MPVLHNYLRVDTDTFCADVARPTMLLAIIAQVLNAVADTIDDMTQAQAAKLLECMVLQMGTPRVDAFLPQMLQLALTRLTRACDSSELRVMLLQVGGMGLAI